jgi:hypothetical protein
MPTTVPLADRLLARFEAIYKDPAHYEASYYGPIDMLLTCYFPAVDGFMVKPQARAGSGRTRRLLQPGCGQPCTDGNPDFLISTGSAQLHSDVPLLTWEVKKLGVSDVDAAKQMVSGLSDTRGILPQIWRL